MPRSHRSKKRNKNKIFHHPVAKALLIAVAVVSFWRGAWGLMDMYLFPENLLASHILSLGVGVGILFFTHYLIKELM